MIDYNRASMEITEQVIHSDLPKYPADSGPKLAREVDRRLAEIETARVALRASLASAEEALLAVAEQEEARSERHDRLQAYITKKGPRAVAGGVISLNGGQR